MEPLCGYVLGVSTAMLICWFTNKFISSELCASDQVVRRGIFFFCIRWWLYLCNRLFFCLQSLVGFIFFSISLHFRSLYAGLGINTKEGIFFGYQSALLFWRFLYLKRNNVNLENRSSPPFAVFVGHRSLCSYPLVLLVSICGTISFSFRVIIGRFWGYPLIM